MLPASHVYDRYSFLHITITRVVCPSMYAQDSFSLPTDLPHSWVNLNAFKHIILVGKLPVCNKSNCQMWGTKRHKVQQQHLTLRQKASRELNCAQHPHFFLENNSSNLCVLRFWPCWVMTEDWAEFSLTMRAIPLWQSCTHCHISLVYQVVVGILCDRSFSMISLPYEDSPSLQLWRNDRVIYFWAT